MLYIHNTKTPNGAHANLIVSETICTEGWALVPDHLEEKALSYLPFINVIVEDSVVVECTHDTEAWEAFEAWKAEQPTPPEPQIDDITALQLAVAELAETQAADQTANELALVELAEMMGG